MWPRSHPIVSNDSLEFLVWVGSLLAPSCQQGQQRFVDEHSTLVSECPDDFPKDHRFTKCILGGIVRREDRWLTDEGEPLVDPSFDLAK